MKTEKRLLSVESISPEGYLRLLDITWERLVYSYTAVPFVGVALAYLLVISRQHIPGFFAWVAFYFLCAVVIRVVVRKYKADKLSLSSVIFINKWLLILQNIALIHGLALSASIILIAGRTDFTFTTLLHVCITVIIAINATHQTAVLSVFMRFFLPCWAIVIISLPWTFGDNLLTAFLLAILYAITVYRHARVAHGFMIKQVMLEEETSRLARENQLAREKAEKALLDINNFLSTASHDLRQPVQAMVFLIDAIVRRNKQTDVSSLLLDLKQSVHSVNIMFTSLLDLSKIESDVLKISNSAVDLQPILDDVITVFKEEAKSRGLAIKYRRSRKKVFVEGDAILIKRVLLNLTHNALRYTKSGRVLITTRNKGSDCYLEVWDTGIGIADRHRDRIFSPFYKIDKPWKKDTASYGLGLSVVSRCVQLMNCECGLQSVEGKGSRFWVRFRSIDKAVQSAIPASNPLQALDTGIVKLTGNCLIVDDDPLLISAWTTLMDTWGVNVRCASNSAEATAVIQEGFMPDVILCDQRLRSGESGFEVLKYLLALSPDSSGAMISGEYNSDALKQAVDEGYIVLQKPVALEQLLVLLESWFKKTDSSAQLVG